MSSKDSSSSSSSTDASDPLRLSSVSFSTKDCTRATYDQFITDIKNIVVDPNLKSRHLNVPALRSETGDPKKDLFKIHLMTGHNEKRVSIVGCTHNLYLVAYETDKKVFWFTDTTKEDMERVFPSKHFKLTPLGMQASYTKLVLNSNITREGMKLGVDIMANAISKLSDPKNGGKKPVVASAFLVLLQMVAESVRLRKLNRKIRECFEPDVNGVYSETIVITEYDAKCQNTWGTLSREFRNHDNMSAKLTKVIEIAGGEIITEEDIQVADQTGVDPNILDGYYVTNMSQVRHIVDVLNSI